MILDIRGISLFKGMDKGYLTEEGVSKINQNFYTLLNTPKGSLIGNRNYGSTLHQILFQDQKNINYIQAKIAILEATTIWMPFIKITDISFRREEEKSVSIIIKYALKGFSSDQIYVADVNYVEVGVSS